MYPGAREAVAALVARYRVVAVVSGRRSEEVAGLLGVAGVRYEGLYGLRESLPELSPELLEAVRDIASAVPAAWVEEKGVSVAVHYRQAPDPAEARVALVADLLLVAERAELELVEGKRVLELLPAGPPRKGGVVERVAVEEGLRAVLFAGDDAADLDAFAALGRLAERGVFGVKVVVRGDETPEGLTATADLVVNGPAGLVELLRQLA